MNKLIYKFSPTLTEGSVNMRNILGAKGSHLANMCNLGVSVPPGFTISSELKKEQFQQLLPQLQENIKWLEQINNKNFGGENPLLLSIRSGAAVSMPGMMDTILNLGLNDFTVQKLASATSNKRFALDSYRRFISMFGSVVLKVSIHLFESELTAIKFRNRITHDYELNVEMLEDLIATYKKIVIENTGSEFPVDVYQQLELAIVAVLESWHNERAVSYRNALNISDVVGTAVNVQTMVFGNLNTNSATGVVFSRNPSDGSNEICGEYLINAQGEDIVSGVRTPSDISDQSAGMHLHFPKVLDELKQNLKFLENHYKDIQDVEFTIEDSKLFILQTRTAKRTVNAAVKIAYDLAESGLISRNDALMRIPVENINTLFYETIDISKSPTPLCTGLPASPGAVSGIAVFCSQEAESMEKCGTQIILVRNETNPDDIAGIIASAGVLTAKGGITSHAAVVARGMGTPCVTGASHIEVHEQENYCRVMCDDNDSAIIRKGDIITIDGSTGKIILGQAPKTKNTVCDEFYELLNWAKATKRIAVNANAENINDVSNAINFGADGIGLCRTEHMFLEAMRLKAIRRLILAQDDELRSKILDEIFELQKQDFIKLFKILNGLPISIRLLDPPLHEFLPKSQSEISKIALELNVNTADLNTIIDGLAETNPMLGHRGVRLGVTNPKIFNTQIDAIAAAAIAVSADHSIESDIKANVEIMMPLVSEVAEITPFIKRINMQFQDCPKSVSYKIGTMIELPKAAIIADKIAKHVDFFSYGTNDLTQTTLGISRDDAARLIQKYTERGIYKRDPFVSVDIDAVGYLLKLATQNGRDAKPNLKVGVCGEHGGDHNSIIYFASIGCDYVSCSPFRVMSATFSAAQAQIMLQEQREEGESSTVQNA